MDLYRPEKMEEFEGNDDIVRLVMSRAKQGKLSHFTIFIGDEGIGKTTLVNLVAMTLDCGELEKPCYKCKTCVEIRDKIIRKNVNTQDVRKFTMTEEDGGIAAAKAILGELNANYIEGKAKVIIMEDIHGMCRAAQEMLLSAFEYIPKDVYVLATANSLNNLLAKFVSRAVRYNMKHLQKRAMIKLLRAEALRRDLNVASPAIYEIIATWSDCKPRTALKVLEAMGESCSVSLDDVKAYVSYLEISKVIPILDSFTGSPLVGIAACMKLPTDSDTQKYFIEFLVSAIQIKYNQHVTNLSVEDKELVKEAVRDINPRVLEDFLLEISRMPQLDTRRLLAAYLTCHPQRQQISKNSSLILDKEIQDKMNTNAQEDIDENKVVSRQFRGIDQLMRESVVQEGDNDE